MATSLTLSILDSVLGFDVIEFWSPDDKNELQCQHVHFSESVKQVLKRICGGDSVFTPAASDSWKRNSLKLCDEARKSEIGYIWASVSHRHLFIPRQKAKEEVTLPVTTEVAHPITDDMDRQHFVVCYTRSEVVFSSVKIKYMSYICEAALIASRNFQDPETDDSELDRVSYKPRSLVAYGSSLDMAEMSQSGSSVIEMGCWSTHESVSQVIPGLPVRQDSGQVGLPPTWEPVDIYSFPVARIPAVEVIPDDLTFDNFQDLRHLADGSNSNVYTARFQGQQVIVKIISERARTNRTAVHEFDVEHGMLARMNHPNVVRLLGAGRQPRRFIVLEYLDGGSLSEVLHINEKKKGGIAHKLFKKNTFTFSALLSMGRDMADAFHYLHNSVHKDATVIHRDIKPDNVGFTSDGTIKILDFGLCTCVKKRESIDECYEMTGNTGSLRYMAPEVALKQPYNEKIDVYSFGILLWQMARDKAPYKGLSREEFMSRVVQKGLRPKIDRSWNKDFANLIESCWHEDHTQRPSFEAISHSLTRIAMMQKGHAPPRRNTLKTSQTQSTWF